MAVFLYTDFFRENAYKPLIQMLTFTYNGADQYNIGIGPLWYISTLVQLLLISPFVYKFVFEKIKKYKLLILVLILLAGLVQRIILCKLGFPRFEGIHIAAWVNLDLFFGAFFLNSLLEKKQMKYLKAYKIIAWIALIALMLFEAYLVYAWETAILYYITPTIQAMIVLALLFLYSQDDEACNYKNNLLVPVVKFFGWIGLISFPFYLVHIPIINIVAKHINAGYPNHTLYVCIIVSFILSAIVSMILYLFIEKPLLGFRKKMGIKKS